MQCTFRRSDGWCLFRITMNRQSLCRKHYLVAQFRFHTCQLPVAKSFQRTSFQESEFHQSQSEPVRRVSPVPIPLLGEIQPLPFHREKKRFLLDGLAVDGDVDLKIAVRNLRNFDNEQVKANIACVQALVDNVRWGLAKRNRHRCKDLSWATRDHPGNGGSRDVPEAD